MNIDFEAMAVLEEESQTVSDIISLLLVGAFWWFHLYHEINTLLINTLNEKCKSTCENMFLFTNIVLILLHNSISYFIMTLFPYEYDHYWQHWHPDLVHMAFLNFSLIYQLLLLF